MSCTYKGDWNDCHYYYYYCCCFILSLLLCWVCITRIFCHISCPLLTDKCTEKLEGDNYTIILNSAKQREDVLIWKCNDTVIYQRVNETVRSTVNVDDKGSLFLTNLNSSMSCTYTAEHQNFKGKLLASASETLFVLCKYSNENVLQEQHHDCHLVNSLEVFWYGTDPQLLLWISQVMWNPVFSSKGSSSKTGSKMFLSWGGFTSLWA